jgi:hypothetical protein
MNIIKTSIQATIVTILLFLFIIFISLFKGLTLYNINIQNINIKKIFIKIEQNKITSKIYLNSLPASKGNNNIYKIITYLNFLNYFKKINISAPNLNIFYNNHYLIFKQNDLTFNAYINKHNIYMSYLKYKNFEFNNINCYIKNNITNYKIKGSLYYKFSLINFNAIFYPISNKINLILNSNNLKLKIKDFLIVFNNFHSKIKININNNKLNSVINSKKVHIKSDKIEAYLNNLTSTINLNLDTNNIFSITNIKYSTIKYKNLSFNIQKAEIIQNNKNIQFLIDHLTNRQINILKNISINKINVSTNLLTYHSSLLIQNIIAKYKDFFIKLNNINIIFFNKNKIFSKISQANIKNTKYNFLLNKITVTKKENNISYEINTINFLSDRLKANSSKIIGNKEIILNKIISGIFDQFNFTLKHNKFDIKNKTFISKKINFNNINVTNVKINLIKKYATFTSKAYFNKKINDILKKELNISIPIKQINGKNDIKGIITFDKNISFNIKAISKNPILQLDTLPLQAKETNITITPTFTSFVLNKSHLEIAPGVNLFFSGSGIINYKNLILTLNGIIENFVIDPILNIKNFKETAKIDLNSLELYLKNSHTYINLNKKNIIINNLKNILPYTPFKDLIDNGLLFISFAENIKVLTYIKPKLYIFYKHNNKPITKLNSNINLHRIMLNIELNKDQTVLYNKFINFFMKKNNAFLELKNIDINLYPLEKYYYQNINKQNKNKFNIIITSKNSNILYKTHKFLSQKAELTEINNSITLHSIYKTSKLKGYTKHNYFLLEGQNFSKEEFNAFLPKLNFFKEINIDFTLVKSPDNYYIGNVYINKGIIKELKILNNIMAFLNTIPSILSLSSPGFSAKGYEIKQGNIQYLLYKNIFYIKNSKIIGKNIDFISKGYIDLNKNYINLKIKAKLKLKLKKIPIVGKGLSYLLLGKDGSITVNILVNGNLDNPKIEKDIGKAIIPNPFKLFKRALTLPFNLF